MRSRACHRLISPESESLLALPKSNQKASPYCPPDPEVARKTNRFIRFFFRASGRAKGAVASLSISGFKRERIGAAPTLK